MIFTMNFNNFTFYFAFQTKYQFLFFINSLPFLKWTCEIFEKLLIYTPWPNKKYTENVQNLCEGCSRKKM